MASSSSFSSNNNNINSSGPSWANPHAPTTSTTSSMQDESISITPNDVLLQPYSTLEEPISETIMRDVRAVGSKLRVVLLPLDRNSYTNLLQSPFGYTGVSSSTSTNASSSEEQPQQQDQDQQDQNEIMGENQRRVINSLKDWDLWGPLFVCLSLSVVLSFKAPTNQASLVFASVFLSVWVGSAVVTVNATLLGATISFFQTVCVLGYCVFPLLLAAVGIGMLKLVVTHVWLWLELTLLVIAFVWATRASAIFIGQYIGRTKRTLAVFPVLFFYTFLCWLILLF